MGKLKINPLLIRNPGYRPLERRLIEIAFETIQNCSNGKSKHVSFLVKRNKINSVGWNNEFASHPLSQKYNYYGARIHSELHSIIRYRGKSIEDNVVFNIRINRQNEVVSSMPCQRCQYLMRCYGIKNCCYTNKDGCFEWLHL